MTELAAVRAWMVQLMQGWYAPRPKENGWQWGGTEDRAPRSSNRGKLALRASGKKLRKFRCFDLLNKLAFHSGETRFLPHQEHASRFPEEMMLFRPWPVISTVPLWQDRAKKFQRPQSFSSALAE